MPSIRPRPSRPRPQNSVTFNNIPVEFTYWRRRPNIVRMVRGVNGVEREQRTKLKPKAYDARVLKRMAAQGMGFFPNNRTEIDKKQMNQINVIALGVPRAHRQTYRQDMTRRNKLVIQLSKLHLKRMKLDLEIASAQQQINLIERAMRSLPQHSPATPRSPSPQLESRRVSPRRSHHASPVSNSNVFNTFELQDLERIVQNQLNTLPDNQTRP